MKKLKFYGNNRLHGWQRVGQTLLLALLLLVGGLAFAVPFTPKVNAARLADFNEGICKTKTSTASFYMYEDYNTSYECMWKAYDRAYESGDGWGYGNWYDALHANKFFFRVNEEGKVEVWNGYRYKYRYYLY